MKVLILRTRNSRLLDDWADELVRRLRAEGHEPLLRPPASLYHAPSLRAALAELDLEGGRIAILDEDTMTYPGWAAHFEAHLDAHPRVALVAAQHGWRFLPGVASYEVATPEHPAWPGQFMPIPDNAAAWNCVLDVDRLRAAGLRLRDLNWEPDGFLLRYDDDHRVVGASGLDTGGRVVGQLRAAGLGSILLPTRTAPVGYGALVTGVSPRDQFPTHEWLVFHFFFGRLWGRPGRYPVGSHLLDLGNVTQHAFEALIRFQKEKQ